MKYLHDEALFRLQRKALQHGGRTVILPGDLPAHRTVEWDISGRCHAPVTIERRSRRDVKRGKHVSTETGLEAAKHRSITMHVECRKCAVCLAKRRHRWTTRAKAEVAAAARTWFVTFTLTPAWQQKCLDEARHSLAKQGLDFEALAPSDRFGERQKVTAKLITLFLKRLREATGARVRYLLVAEAHKSGAPHYHMLLHHTADTVVTYDDIEKQWRHGFFKAKLVRDDEPAVASYVCKYLAKSADARVRASADYGNAQTSLRHSETGTPRKEVGQSCNVENGPLNNIPIRIKHPFIDSIKFRTELERKPERME